MLGSAEYNVSYSNIQGGYDGEGNFDEDPQFCNPPVGNYQLAENSSSLNSGLDGSHIGYNGDPGCAEPYNNYSLSFDGQDDYVQIGTPGSDNNGTDSDIGSLLGDGPFSVSFWYNTSENPNGDYEFIIDQRRNLNNGDGWTIMNENGKIKFDIQTGSTWTRVNGSTTIPTDAWNHITCTWDGASGNIYFNGVLDASEDIPSRRNNSVGMAIGTRYSHNEKFLNGNIDQIKVWDYSMAQDQIQDDMYSELNGDEESGEDDEAGQVGGEEETHHVKVDGLDSQPPESGHAWFFPGAHFCTALRRKMKVISSRAALGIAIASSGWMPVFFAIQEPTIRRG